MKIISFLIIFLFVSCIQTPAAPKKLTVDSDSTTTTDDDDDDDVDDSATVSTESYWYTVEKITGPIVLNENFSDTLYIRGEAINSLLSESEMMQQNYCLKGLYSTSNIANGTVDEIILRALPYSTTNYTTLTKEYVLRIEPFQKSDNESICSSTATTSATVAYQIKDSCPTCSKTFKTSSMSLYVSGGNTSAYKQLDFESLILGIDPTLSITNNPVSCSDNECQASGYDCCLSGQCVIDGAERPNASEQANYLQAMADVTSSPANFTKYDSIFFICSTPSSTDPIEHVGDDDPEEGDEEALVRLQESLYIFCSFDEDDIDEDICSTPKTEGINSVVTDTTLSSPTYISPQTTTPYYDEETRTSKIQELCQCEAEDPDDCPDYILSPVLDGSSYLRDFICSEIEQTEPGDPFQDLDVTVSGKMIPHRFFAENGETYKTLTKALTAGVTQEGDAYSPESTSTNINRNNINNILGNFNTNGLEAYPAKVIDIDIGSEYIIATKTGQFTPCPECAKDFWYDQFSKFPESADGKGMQSTGYSASRNSYEDNSHLGNYEDTLFGRACFIPPTMIPWTHSQIGTVQENRLARLETQAAFWNNGYQRDWYGFNYGALIGSFDGVKWFAVGSGRIAYAHTDKLYLAYNSPYGDLNLDDNITVSVVKVEDVSIEEFSEYDYDIEKGPFHRIQNQGGSCQAYHQCEVDSDCVTQLGWEYMCANVGPLKTKWPDFDNDATELIDEIDGNLRTRGIQNFDSSSLKRCVYRGRGSLCKVDPSNGIGNEKLAKNLTCAPNFHCEPFKNDSSNYNKVFSSKASRETSTSSISYSHLKDFLGVPQEYISGSFAFPNSDNVIANINEMSLDVPATQQSYGLCIPGRGSDATLIDAHSKSTLKPDFISQIGSASTFSQVRTCPVFTDAGDYLFGSDLENPETYGIIPTKLSQIQNTSGSEVLNPSTVNIFANIELTSVPTSLLEAQVYKNACFRRAGSTCFTDLDCSPGKLHSKEAEAISWKDFGTLAEKEYWQESLICGQADDRPSPYDDDAYQAYDITKNVCCRAQGEDFTMYTEIKDTKNTKISDEDTYQDLAPSQIFESNGTLKTSDHRSESESRYSRYKSVSAINSNSTGGVCVILPRSGYPSNTTECGNIGNSAIDGIFTWDSSLNLCKNESMNFNRCREFQQAWYWCKDSTALTDNDRINDVNSCSTSGLQLFWYTEEGICSDNSITNNLDCIDYDKNDDETKSKCSDSDGDDLADCLNLNGRWISENQWKPFPKVYSKGEPIENQWMTINETGQKNCCGGGFIRKFADGTHNWTQPGRLELDLTNFQCLNYINELHDETIGGVTDTSNRIYNYEIGRKYSCQSTALEADMGFDRWYGAPCIQPYIPTNTNFELDAPKELEDQTVTIYTAPLSEPILGTGTMNYHRQANLFKPYIPIKAPNSANSNNTYIAFEQDTDYENNENEVSIYWPHFVDPEAVVSIKMVMYDSSTGQGTSYGGSSDNIDIIDVLDDLQGAATNNTCDGAGHMSTTGACVDSTTEPGKTILHMNFSSTFTDWYGGLEIEFYPVGTEGYYKKIASVTGTKNTGLQPGNDLYYQTKLGRFELLGIPQITYEPVYCNTNRSEIVPGLFDSTLITNREDFKDESFPLGKNPMTLYQEEGAPTFDPALQDEVSSSTDKTDYYPTYLSRAVLQDKVELEAVFSSHEFTCCKKAGKTTDSNDKCCSGYSAIDATSGELTCQIPAGTDLHVYLNKFVSSEGIVDPDIDEDQYGLDYPDDFIPETGEPKNESSVWSKIWAYGEKYCSHGAVTTGTFYGSFTGSPTTGNPGSINSFIDESGDESNGYSFFTQGGLHWTHHIYCSY